MLKIEKVNVRYGGIVALQDVSVEVRRASSLLLVGANGAGKSSLINAVIGLVPWVSGTRDARRQGSCEHFLFGLFAARHRAIRQKGVVFSNRLRSKRTFSLAL